MKKARNDGDDSNASEMETSVFIEDQEQLYQRALQTDPVFAEKEYQFSKTVGLLSDVLSHENERETAPSLQTPIAAGPPLTARKEPEDSAAPEMKETVQSAEPDLQQKKAVPTTLTSDKEVVGDPTQDEKFSDLSEKDSEARKKTKDSAGPEMKKTVQSAESDIRKEESVPTTLTSDKKAVGDQTQDAKSSSVPEKKLEARKEPEDSAAPDIEKTVQSAEPGLQKEETVPTTLTCDEKVVGDEKSSDVTGKKRDATNTANVRVSPKKKRKTGIFPKEWFKRTTRSIAKQFKEKDAIAQETTGATVPKPVKPIVVTVITTDTEAMTSLNEEEIQRFADLAPPPQTNPDMAECPQKTQNSNDEKNKTGSSDELLNVSNNQCPSEQRVERLQLKYPDGDDASLDILERPKSPEPPSFQPTTKLFHITRPTTSTSLETEEIDNSEKNLERILELDTGKRDAFLTLLKTIKYPKKDEKYPMQASLHAIGLLETMISRLRQFQLEDVKKHFHTKVFSYVTQADQCLKMLLEKVTLSFDETAIEGPIENEALRKVSVMMIKLMILLF